MIANITGVLVSGSVGPANPPVPSVSWPRGADGSIVVTVVDEAGNPVSLAGRVLYLGVATSNTAQSRLFVRQGVNTNASAGVCTFTIAASDTSQVPGARLRMDVWEQASDGRVPLTKTGDFIVLDAIVLPGDTPSPASPIPPNIWGAVDTVNTTGTTLAAVDASTLTDGIPMWVRQAGQGYWHIEIGKGYPIDSTHIAALGLAGGQWVQGLGPNSGGGGSGLVIESIGQEWGSVNTGSEDVVDDPRVVDFDEIEAESLIAKLLAHVKVTAGTGTYRVRIGGTLGLPDGTIIATGTTTSTTYTKVALSASSFANPTGRVLLQVTLQNDTVGEISWIKGASVELVPA